MTGKSSYYVLVCFYMSSILNEQKIKSVVQKTVRAELMRFFTALLPEISSREQKEIETKFGKPSEPLTKEYRVNL